MVMYVKDRTGRFAERPHYSEAELDSECEQIISNFLCELNGTVSYPVATDDLTKLIESRTADLDLYADLSGAGEDHEPRNDYASIIYLFALPPSMVAESRPEYRPETLSGVCVLRLAP